VVQETLNTPPVHAADSKPVNEVAPAAASESRHAILEERAQRLAADFAALKKSVQQSRAQSSATKSEDTKWRHIPVTNIDVKFAVSLLTKFT
jgi:molecular chaperone GrpE (heat shock protein)